MIPMLKIKDKIIILPDEIMKRLVGSAKYLAKIWPYFASLSAEIEPTRIGTTVNSFFCSKHQGYNLSLREVAKSKLYPKHQIKFSKF